MTLGWVIVACLLAGGLSVLAAAFFLTLDEQRRHQLLPHLISFATGSLLGAAFLVLLPHALEYPGAEIAHQVSFTVLLGLLGFFVMEKLVLWRHCHHDPCEAHAPDGGATAKMTGTLLFIGDGIHNLIHGVLLAASFMTDFHVGLVTAIAIIAHQIPQQLGNFAVLLHSGFSRSRALVMNVLSSLVAVIGGIIGFVGLEQFSGLLPHMLAVAVASCIYIAVSDLIPDMHKTPHPRVSLQQGVMISAGVIVIMATHSWLH